MKDHRHHIYTSLDTRPKMRNKPFWAAVVGCTIAIIGAVVQLASV